MDRLELNYEDISMETRTRAGLKGVSFTTREHGDLITVFKNDSNLINAIDNALYDKYKKDGK